MTSVAGQTTDLDKAYAQASRDARAQAGTSLAHARLARILAALGRPAEGVAVLRQGLQLGGGHPEDIEAIAFAAFTLDDHLLARQCYGQVVDMAPGDGLARYNLASAERNLGAMDAAEAAAGAALDRDPTLYQAALLRSQVRTQTDQCNHVEDLQSRLSRHAAYVPAQIFLNYALGKELEDLGRYREAFACFQAGATARRRSMDYSVDRDLAILQRIAAVYGPDVLAARRPAEAANNCGFILGLPRSGTTLLERVLTGHKNVRSNGETDNFLKALMAQLSPGPGDIFDRAARCDHASVGAAYRKLAGQPPAAEGLLLEKLPLNYLYVGAIALALPEAPIVILRRNPLDNCLAMFTTLFGAAYPFTYDLTELARYFAGYVALKNHWIDHLADQIIEIDYERFVGDPALQGERVATHCGLAWNPAAIRIEENFGASTTASAVQIRQPIYTNARERWRRYELELAPLRKELKQLGVPTD